MLKLIISSLFIFGVVFGRPSEEKATLEFEIPEISDKIVQFQQQLADGQYSYTYANPLSAKSEVRSLNGITNGVYKYVDSDGKTQIVQYHADDGGFDVIAATNYPEAPKVPELPKLEAPLPVTDTPEVAEARSKHLEALKLAEKSGGEEPEQPTKIETTVTNPAPVLSHPVSFYGIPPSNVQVLPFSSSPLVTLNYQIPGASFSYATYQAPILQYGFPFHLIGNNGVLQPQGVQENLVKEEAEDTVTIEAKTVPEEAQEKKE